jgi:hypothetical protein
MAHLRSTAPYEITLDTRSHLLRDVQYHATIALEDALS